jgi:hypothetical protein
MNLNVKNIISEPSINVANVKEGTTTLTSVRRVEVEAQAVKIGEYSIIRI